MLMRQVQEGDMVAVHYTGKLDDGSVFDSSRDGDPIEFEVGSGSVIHGFENAVRGMEVGQTREVRLDPDDAYGPRRDDLEVEVARDRLPPGIDAKEGEMLAVQVAPDQQAVARITGVDGDNVTLDLNHPLAGKALHFDIEVVDIRDAA
jgi:peptidylprolyl isomerase